MEQVLHVFGIDWKLLLINAANFGLLLAALTYFFYKPMMRMLDLRRDKIAHGVEAAQKAEAELKEKVLSDETVKKWMENKPIRKFIVVPGRLVNIIV